MLVSISIRFTDDDDDEDDDVSPSTGVVQQPAAQQPLAPTSVADEISGADYPGQ